MKHASMLLVAIFAVSASAQTANEDRAVARACRADAEHMCSGKTGQEMNQCLKSNQAKLSSNCKDALSKVPGQPQPKP